jgi:hypothetical protein
MAQGTVSPLDPFQAAEIGPPWPLPARFCGQLVQTPP